MSIKIDGRSVVPKPGPRSTAAKSQCGNTSSRELPPEKIYCIISLILNNNHRFVVDLTGIYDGWSPDEIIFSIDRYKSERMEKIVIMSTNL
jgi:hypothetical protein